VSEGEVLGGRWESWVTGGKFQYFLLKREENNLSWLLLTTAGKVNPGFPRALVSMAIADKLAALGALRGLGKESKL